MKKRTVLIVDDQATNRAFLAKAVGSDYRVWMAENGLEALNLLREKAEAIDAVLLDIVMPVMDGYEVLRTMRADEQLRLIPVIVTSQLIEEKDELLALELGAQDFVLKPYKPEIVRHRLANTIRLRENAATINHIQRDELTGLYNRGYFIHRVGDVLRRSGSSYDLLYIGIECFKMLNDSYGTKKGNEVLRYLADSIRDFVSESCVCARFYADNFFVLAPHHAYTKADFIPFTERMRACPAVPGVKVHCGILADVDATVSVEGLCDRAEMAGKANAAFYRDSFTYYSETLSDKLKLERFIVDNMQAALDEEQFEVYYQPKFDVTSEHIIGAEALVRWQHPERGFVPVWEFIPIFERNGFITQMDIYVWETTCKNLHRWRELGYPEIPVSVNMSRADIDNPHIAEILLELVHRYEIPIRNLHLEITESAYAESPDQIIAVVEGLRGLGFLVEMDDFGTGYSSLNMVSSMPVDVLKLDMRFIQKEATNASGRGVLGFIISLAKWMGLLVVAEGVETHEQIELLRTLDCRYIQGYYYAKPMPRDAFERFVGTAAAAAPARTPPAPVIDPTLAAHGPINGLKNGRVMLLVDDVEVNRAVLSVIFRDDYVIVEAEDGHTAWEYLQQHADKVDVVMLDLLMPVMDGFELLEKIRTTPLTRNLPVVITSQGSPDAERRTLEMQANDYVVKPYDPDSVYRRVHNVVDSARYHKLVADGKAAH